MLLNLRHLFIRTFYGFRFICFYVGKVCRISQAYCTLEVRITFITSFDVDAKKYNF